MNPPVIIPPDSDSDLSGKDPRAVPRTLTEQLAQIQLDKLHAGNRLRLMMGLPPLPEWPPGHVTEPAEPATSSALRNAPPPLTPRKVNENPPPPPPPRPRRPPPLMHHDRRIP